MYVIKRSGKQEPVKFDKITARISKLVYGLDSNYIEPIDVAKKVFYALDDEEKNAVLPAIITSLKHRMCASSFEDFHHAF